MKIVHEFASIICISNSNRVIQLSITFSINNIIWGTFNDDLKIIMSEFTNINMDNLLSSCLDNNNNNE